MKANLFYYRTGRSVSSEYVWMKFLLNFSYLSKQICPLLVAHLARANPTQKVENYYSEIETKTSEALVKIAFCDRVETTKQIEKTSFGYIAIILVRVAYILIQSERTQLDHHEIKCMETRSISFILPLALSHKLMFTLDCRHHYRDQNGGHGPYGLHPGGPFRVRCSTPLSYTQHAERDQHGHYYQRNVLPVEKQLLSEIATHHHLAYLLFHFRWLTDSNCSIELSCIAATSLRGRL